MRFSLSPNVRRASLAAALLLAAGSLAACGSSSSSGSSPSATEPTPTPTATAALTVTDPWVKAAESGMTAAFATLSNPGSTDVTVVSATTSASDRTELHEMVMQDGQMVMQPIEGGFVIPAGGELTLQPGGNHIMIMDLMTPIKPGDEVQVTLVTDAGPTVEFTAVAKEYSGASESYAPGGGMSGSGMASPMPSGS